MRWFYNLKIGTRPTCGFSVVMLFMIAIAGVGIAKFNNMMKDSDKMSWEIWPKSVAANNMVDSIKVMTRANRNGLLVDDKDVVRKELNLVAESRPLFTNG